MTNKVAKYWDEASDKWYKDNESYIDRIIENPSLAFPSSVYQLICKSFSSLEGVKVCVPSSGDNIAAFAFHLLGAKVCSTDISSQQIENAKKVTLDKGWDIEFHCDDTMKLNKLNSDTYDLVYTSNGVHVWINDLKSMHSNINRILKNKGSFIFFDTHPFIRPFNGEGNEVKVVKDYDQTSPFPDETGMEYAWRIEDYVNSLASSDFMIMNMSEFKSSPTDLPNYNYLTDSEEDLACYNWQVNPWAALPQCLAMRVIKK